MKNCNCADPENCTVAVDGCMKGRFVSQHCYALSQAKLKEAEEWIDVNDRLPEPNVGVLVGHMNQWDGWWPAIAKHDGNKFLTPIRVTHWQPLPSPPAIRQRSEGGV